MSNCYCNIINGISFSFIIEDKIFDKNPLFFDYFFKKWIKKDVTEITNDMTIIGKSKRRTTKENYIYTSTSNEKWMFLLINDIEKHIINRLECYVLHGASLIYKNKVICLLGPRKSGKTTIVYNLTKNDDYVLIDDDCVILDNNNVIGLNFPIRLRNKLNDAFPVIDDDKKTRYLYFTKNSQKNCTYQKVFLFIQYNNNENITRKMSNKDFFDNLLINSRYSTNTIDKFNKIINITKSQEAYQIMFTSFDNFLDFLKKLNL